VTIREGSASSNPGGGRRLGREDLLGREALGPNPAARCGRSDRGIETTVAGTTFAQYRRTWQTCRAVERDIEIISETTPPRPVTTGSIWLSCHPAAQDRGAHDAAVRVIASMNEHGCPGDRLWWDRRRPGAAGQPERSEARHCLPISPSSTVSPEVASGLATLAPTYQSFVLPPRGSTPAPNLESGGEIYDAAMGTAAGSGTDAAVEPRPRR
jgi:hypothetical protein